MKKILTVLLISISIISFSGCDILSEFFDTNVDDNVADDNTVDDNTGDNQKPNVSFTKPTSGSTVGKDLGVIVKATDPDGDVVEVELYINNSLVRVDMSSPYTWGTENNFETDNKLLDLSPGSYNLKAIATDDVGDSTTANISVTVPVSDPVAEPLELGNEPDDYLTYDEIVQLIKSWANAGPEIMEVGTYGSGGGYKNYYLRISAAVSDTSLKLPRAMINSCIHGDEWIATATVMAVMHRFLKKYGKNDSITNLIQTRDIYLIPVVNPASYDMRTRYEDGEDPNRSFPWPGDQNNQPTPNVSRMMNFFINKKFNSVIEYHASGRMVLMPWGYKKDKMQEGDHGSKHRNLIKKMGNASNYQWGSIPDMVGYICKGDSGDWAYIEGQKRGFNTAVIGMEAGRSKKPPVSDIPVEANRNYNLMVIYINEAPILLTDSRYDNIADIETPRYDQPSPYFVPGEE